MNTDKIKAVQRVLGVVDDGIWGPKSKAALGAILAPDGPSPESSSDDWNVGKASSFADPADVRAFRKCKQNGGSDLQCFKVGDNGVGCWGDDTSEGSGMSCAIPPDDMVEKFGSVAGAEKAKVIVEANGRSIVATVKDRMPWKKNIRNGAVIDLNPDAAAALGLNPPFMVNAKWKWA